MYQQALRDTGPGHPARCYLHATRGLTGESVQAARLGYVAAPLPGHEAYAGRLAIPYLTPAGPVSIRFRALPDYYDGEDPVWEDDAPKYLSLPGEPSRLYVAWDARGRMAVARPEPYVCITEGEIDAITATQAGLPAVGVPGVSLWRGYMARVFTGYETVYILADNDDKGQGMAFARTVAEQVPGARIVPMPTGHDVNSYVRAAGAAALLKRLEIDSDS